jgi:hypothetical protein
LPASFSADATDRAVEQEAKAAGVLNHPNITAVHDIGTHEGAPYVVQELLEGETLRSLLAGGRLPARKIIDYSLQIVHGLAAAHEKGIVHRDLKPENIFVTNDGRVKILDFGLAKLTQAEGSASNATNMPTETRGTEPGVVMGTLGYMSPEQVRGKAADPRSDIFSFGAILYEMLSGKRAFQGDTAADTMSSILKEDPPDLSLTNQNVSPGLERIVRHCLEKNPEQRFHSAHDLAFDLERCRVSPRRGSSPAKSRIHAGLPSASWGGRPRGLAIGLFAGRLIWRAGPEPPRASTGSRSAAGRSERALCPDGHDHLLGVLGRRPKSGDLLDAPGEPGVAAAEPSNRGSRRSPHGRDARSDPIAVLDRVRLDRHSRRRPVGQRVAELLEDVASADWSPDGANLPSSRAAVALRLEFPAGRSCRDDRLHQRPAHFSEGRRHRVSRPPGLRRRPRLGRDRGPRRKEKDAVRGMGKRAGPGLVGLRQGDLVHGDPRRQRPLCLRRGPGPRRPCLLRKLSTLPRRRVL